MMLWAAVYRLSRKAHGKTHLALLGSLESEGLVRFDDGSPDPLNNLNLLTWDVGSCERPKLK